MYWLQIFGLIPANNLGAHDSDWEHVTVRLTPDAKHVTGVYYSAHRCASCLSTVLMRAVLVRDACLKNLTQHLQEPSPSILACPGP